MPFTPSHIAAVLPFMSTPRLRRWLDPWALALGSMVPDLPVFLPRLPDDSGLPRLPDYSDWHSVSGIFTLDLLSAVVLLGLFHTVFRDPLIALLPARLAARAATLTPAYMTRPASLLYAVPPILLGAILGSSTHVLWDSFTHSYGPKIWGVPWLGITVLGVVKLFRLLQYISSVIGLTLVIWWSARNLARLPEVPLPDRFHLSTRARRAVLTLSSMGLLLGGFVWPLIHAPNPKFGMAAVITRVGAGTMIGLCLVLTCYAAIWQLRRLMAVFEDA